HDLHSFPTRRSSDLEDHSVSPFRLKPSANTVHFRCQVTPAAQTTGGIEAPQGQRPLRCGRPRKPKQDGLSQAAFMHQEGDRKPRSEEHTSELQSLAY